MDALQQFLSVLLVLGLLAAVWFVIHHAGRRGWPDLPHSGRNGQRELECIARLSLGPQHSLYLVRVGRRQVLLGIHPSGFESLSARSSGFEPAPNEAAE